ncbi:hypothetical protein AB852_14645 [Streptomyces uncialis]|uniref:Uncharacterized protein n=1 Tax=Streptomyces uncialis TaxID=1048205 RepID=A0A1Q4V7X7_9ACTN|nr:hypothetical protein AB852_14645 [Streptomyces uncialis]
MLMILPGVGSRESGVGSRESGVGSGDGSRAVPTYGVTVGATPATVTLPSGDQGAPLYRELGFTDRPDPALYWRP